VVDLVGTLVLADAEHIQRQVSDRYVGATVVQQLQHADWLMLSKPDLVTSAALQSTTLWLQTLAPQARVWASDARGVRPELLLGWPGHAERAAPGRSRGSDTDPSAIAAAVEGADAADTTSITAWARRAIGPAGLTHRDALHAQDVFESRSLLLPHNTDLHGLGMRLAAAGSGVLRAKGLLDRQLLQVAGGRWSVTAMPAPTTVNAPMGDHPNGSHHEGLCATHGDRTLVPSQRAGGQLVMIGLRGHWHPEALWS
jgi:G3E family GTPase